jgi:hypothetical protein
MMCITHGITHRITTEERMKNSYTHALSTVPVLFCEQLMLGSGGFKNVAKQGYFEVIRPIHTISSNILFI